MKLIETHTAIEEWQPSTHRREPIMESSPQDDNWKPHPEQPQTVWDHVWNLGAQATRERQLAGVLG